MTAPSIPGVITYPVGTFKRKPRPGGHSLTYTGKGKVTFNRSLMHAIDDLGFEFGHHEKWGLIIVLATQPDRPLLHIDSKGQCSDRSLIGKGLEPGRFAMVQADDLGFVGYRQNGHIPAIPVVLQ